VRTEMSLTVSSQVQVTVSWQVLYFHHVGLLSIHSIVSGYSCLYNNASAVQCFHVIVGQISRLCADLSTAHYHAMSCNYGITDSEFEVSFS